MVKGKRKVVMIFNGAVVVPGSCDRGECLIEAVFLTTQVNSRLYYSDGSLIDRIAP